MSVDCMWGRTALLQLHTALRQLHTLMPWEKLMCSDIQSSYKLNLACLQLLYLVWIAVNLHRTSANIAIQLSVYLLVVVTTNASVLVIEFSYQCTDSSYNCC